MRISDWSSDVCSSDLIAFVRGHAGPVIWDGSELGISIAYDRRAPFTLKADCLINAVGFDTWSLLEMVKARSEEHTSELQSLMRISYAVFCLKKKTKKNNTLITYQFTITNTSTQTINSQCTYQVK